MTKAKRPKLLNWFEAFMLTHLLLKLINARQLTYLFAEVRRISKYRWYEDSDQQVEELIEEQFDSPKANRLDQRTKRYPR